MKESADSRSRPTNRDAGLLATESATTGGERAEMRRGAMKTGRVELLLLLEVTDASMGEWRTPNRGGPTAD
jgi:hypothetical protein